jgi:hypothetical protein
MQVSQPLSVDAIARCYALAREYGALLENSLSSMSDVLAMKRNSRSNIRIIRLVNGIDKKTCSVRRI